MSATPRGWSRRQAGALRPQDPGREGAEWGRGPLSWASEEPGVQRRKWGGRPSQGRDKEKSPAAHPGHPWTPAPPALTVCEDKEATAASWGRTCRSPRSPGPEPDSWSESWSSQDHLGHHSLSAPPCPQGWKTGGLLGAGGSEKHL